MERKRAEREVVARTPYRPPVPAATRTGGRMIALRVASAGVLVGMTVAAGAALVGSWGSDPVEVRFRAPAASAPHAQPAAAGTRLVIHRAARRVTLVRHGAVTWRGRGPIGCVSGRPWKRLRDRAAVIARACVRLRDGAVVPLAGRVPGGAVVALK